MEDTSRNFDVPHHIAATGSSTLLTLSLFLPPPPKLLYLYPTDQSFSYVSVTFHYIYFNYPKSLSFFTYFPSIFLSHFPIFTITNLSRSFTFDSTFSHNFLPSPLLSRIYLFLLLLSQILSRFLTFISRIFDH